VTKDQALKFRADYIAKGARDFTKPSHFELDPTGFFEVHVEAVNVTCADFHDLSGGVKYPKKETIDQFGIAAGVSYNTMAESTRRDGNAFVGRSQGMTMGPDGQPIMGDVCEYEFDPELRAEEDILKNPAKYGTDSAKRLKVLEYSKMGRQRANTGARSRATLSVLGIQTGFKDLKPQEVFLFSRVMINTKNKMVAEAQLAAISGHAQSLYGPKAPQAIAAPTGEPRRVGPDLEDDFDPAGPGPAAPTNLDQGMENPYRFALSEIMRLHRDWFGPKAQAGFDAAVADPNTTDHTLRSFLDQARNFLISKSVDVTVRVPA
jgi:hypothetical protein